jgi:hypothetical protein
MSTDDDCEEHMQRFRNPDGCCLHCGRPVNRYHPVGPVTITLADPDMERRGDHEFCCWDCLACWAAQQAGGDFVGRPERGSFDNKN